MKSDVLVFKSSLPTYCVILDKLLNFSESQFPIPKIIL